jgi:hypothetical protein
MGLQMMMELGNKVANHGRGLGGKGTLPVHGKGG